MEKHMIMAMIAAMDEELEKGGPNANILKERGRLKMLAGATVLGDGHVAMILDVSALM